MEPRLLVDERVHFLVARYLAELEVHRLEGGEEPTCLGDSELDVETVGMEFSVVLTQVREAAEMLEVGAASEVSVRAEALSAVIRLINDEYFVAVLLQPHGNMGKTRFLLRTKTPALLENLS